MQNALLEDQLLEYVSLSSTQYCLIHCLVKKARQYGFQTLAPAHKNLLMSFLHCSCSECQKSLPKDVLLEAYQFKSETNQILCPSCRQAQKESA